ncbi:Dihydrofolate reductase [Pandoravirus quercus]|uniref:Dihydrofolate reductase n=1 Tax=Pandoravirus quercus TaxID=2107709 RepID=A0A2U7U7W4_9VIRU|nr:Dihydrofolate reductase [Pandoravirus quercus]AVK74512.1 Dihydrofolate reductase [Pandoravirus quercus]
MQFGGPSVIRSCSPFFLRVRCFAVQRQQRAATARQETISSTTGDNRTMDLPQQTNQGGALGKRAMAPTHAPRRAPLVVRLVAVVDENGAMGCTYRSLPWAFKASGQLAALSAMVAGHPVVVGRASAAMGDDALAVGRRTIVLSRASRRYDYHHGHRVCVDTRPKGIPPDAEVAHSVDEVLSLCRDESIIYVVGGQSTFEAFLPYASAIHRFVLSGTLSFAGRTGQTTHFPSLPRGPSLVTHHAAATHDSPGYRVETYITHPSICPPTPGISPVPRMLVTETNLYWHLTRPSESCRTPLETSLVDARRNGADRRRPIISGPSSGASTSTTTLVYPRVFYPQRTDTEDQVLVKEIKDLTLAAHHETLDAVDLEQIAIRDYFDSLPKGHTTNPQTSAAQTGARPQDKGKEKVADDDDRDKEDSTLPSL